MKVAIHQPEFLPWMGFFHKMSLCDTFVLLDTVQFEKNNFQNRNKILFGGEPGWLSLPIEKHTLDTKIKDIRINWTDDKLVKNHLNSIEQNYRKCESFEKLFPFLKKLYEKKLEYLADFNTEFICFMAQALGLETKIIKASELSLSGNAEGGTEVTLEICKALNADMYVSGSGAKTYLDTQKYDEANIKVYFQDFHYPSYQQRGTQEFVSHLSVIDLFFREGKNSLAIIQNSNLKKENL